jgi:hypothetical protein
MQSGMGSDPDPDGQIHFLASPVTLDVDAASERLLVTSTKALGSSAVDGGKSLDIFICYQESVAGSVVPVGGGLYDLSVASSSRHTFSLSAVIEGLAVGTYNVGLCGRSLDAGSWNSNDFSYTTVLIAN